MALSIIDTELLTDIADAVREKTGQSGSISLADIPSEIESIETGGGSSSEWPITATLSAEDAAKSSRISITDFSGVTLTASMFENNSNIVNVELYGATVPLPQYLFRNCTKLEKVTFPENISGMQGSGFFQNCQSITELTFLGNCKLSMNPFVQCTGIERCNVPSDNWIINNIVENSNTSSSAVPFGGRATGFGTYYVNGSLSADFDMGSKTKVWQNTFTHTRVDSISMPNVTDIGSYAFSYAKFPDDYTFKFPDSMTTTTSSNILSYTTLGSVDFNNLTKVPTYCCYYNSGITTVNIPDSVATIESYAFRYASSVTKFDIGSGVATISAYGCQCAASSSKKVTYIFRGSTPPTISSNSLVSSSYITAVYVPADAVDAYKAKTNFTTLASKIQSIPEGM